MNRLLVIFITVLAALGIQGYAQSENTPVAPLNSNYVPETPSIWKHRQANLPTPTLLTGAATFEVPLYTLKFHDITLPFTLSYRSNGIRLNDDPYPCGYGWTLLPSLRITRTIKGRPDEIYPRYNYGGDIDNETFFNCMIEDKSGSSHKDYWDSQHDIFTIILPDKTIPMLYDDGHFYGVDCDEYLVEFKYLGDDVPDGIVVKDPQGYTYYFQAEGGEYYLDEKNRTEWLLHSITAPSGDELTFAWTPWNYATGHKHLRQRALNPAQVRCTSEWRNGQAATPDFSNPIGTLSAQNYGGSNLVEVSGAGVSVTFSYNTDMLTGMKVSFYNPFDNSRSEDNINITFSYDKNSKFLLDQVNHDTDGVYRFDYHTPNNCTNRFDAEITNSFEVSPYQDWWGYYNYNPNEDSNPTLNTSNPQPIVKFKNLEGHTFKKGYYETPGSPREPYEPSMLAYTLKSATIPTGGKIEWKYEMHRFPKTTTLNYISGSLYKEPELSEGGGLRVKEILMYSPTDIQRSTKRTYKYGINGDGNAVCKIVPSLSTFITQQTSVNFYEDNFPLIGLPETYVEKMPVYNISVNSDYLSYLGGTMPIWYQEVTEIYDEGKTVTSYDYQITDNEVQNDTYYTYLKKSSRLLSKGPQITKRVTYKNDDSNQYVPVTTEIYEYDVTSGNTLPDLSITRDYYQIQCPTTAPDLSATSPFVFDTHTVPYEGCPAEGEKGKSFYFDKYFFLYKYGETYVIPCRERLSKKTVTLHTDNGDYTTWEKYGYVNGTSLISKIERSMSDTTAQYSQAISYTPDDVTVATAMKKLNMTGIPVKTTTNYGNAVTSESYTMHNPFEGIIVPRAFTLTRGGTSYTPATYRHDLNGNLIETLREDQTVTSCIWGYAGLYPVHQVEGLNIASLTSQLRTSGVDTDPILFGEGELLNLDGIKNQALITSMKWLPGEGVTSIRYPTGITHGFGYDTQGRLNRTWINSDTLTTTAYNIGLKNGSWYDQRKWLDRSGTNNIITIENLDALGRSSTTVTQANGEYIATLKTYDRMGRQVQDWNATPVGSLHPSENEVYASATEFYGDNAPYMTTLYEKSSREQAVGYIKQGVEWATHPSTVRQLTNTGSEVRNTDYRAPRYTVTSDGIIYAKPYPTGTLLVKEEIDEDGVTLQTYTDMRGLKVLERRGKKGSWLDTRYIYNDYGELCYILPPAVSANKSLKRTDSEMKYYAYWYDYDTRGNVTLRKLPGRDAIKYTYDPAGRLVFMQDGNMSAKGERVVYLYDRYGRKVVTARVGWTESQIKTFLEKVRTATWSGNRYIGQGYTIPDFKETIEMVSYNDAGQIYSCTNGVVTTRYTYDSRGRVSRTYEINNTVGFSITRDYTYSYTDKPLTCLTTYEASSFSIRPTLMEYIYDSADRLITTRVRQGTSFKPFPAAPSSPGDTVSIINNTYDAIGRLTDIRLGSSINRKQSYDVHGWQTSLLTKCGSTDIAAFDESLTIPFRSEISEIDTTEKKIEDTADNTGVVTGPVDFLSPFSINETLEYASGSEPRYNGNISSRTLSEGSYNYTYDIHNRLQRATFKALGNNNANYSTSYSYDSNSNLTSLTRSGVTDITGTVRTYGSHEELYYMRSGNQLTAIGASVAGAAYEGRTGIGEDGTWDISYDANGNVSVDGTRDIASITYNHLDQPETISFGNGTKLINSYDGAGRKFRTILTDATGRTVLTRDYVGDAIVDNGRVVMTRFSGGYFDSSGKVNYYITDYQNNIIRTVRPNGIIVQDADYYPDGELWEEPSAENPYLFGGKERVTLGGLRMDDFGARIYHSAIATWMQPDPMCEHTPHISPYTYCNGNPIMLIDPTGRLVEAANDSVNMTTTKKGVEYHHLNTITTKRIPIISDIHDFIFPDHNDNHAEDIKDAGTVAGAASGQASMRESMMNRTSQKSTGATISNSNSEGEIVNSYGRGKIKAINYIGKVANGVALVSSLDRLYHDITDRDQIIVPIIRTSTDIVMMLIPVAGPYGIAISVGYQIFDIKYGDKVWHSLEKPTNTPNY